jgi:D-glycero-D-manno-heptose 1,7-bisphosphate phosphatase
MADKALFLDRDGVINIDHGYVGTVERFEFQDGIFDLVRTAIGQGYRPVVITNQAGVARGFYDEADFARLTAWMRARFVEQGAPLAAVYYCPCHRDGKAAAYARDSYWRKPNPGMILEAARRHGLDLSRSVFVGDQPTDMTAAAAAGVGRRFFLGEAGKAGTAATEIIAGLGEATAALTKSFAPAS